MPDRVGFFCASSEVQEAPDSVATPDRGKRRDMPAESQNAAEVPVWTKARPDELHCASTFICESKR
ncbi:MAG: hypothetical protein HQ492_04050 [Woeseiaceae bacterium]|nr:hypothetical protein [Woeseiaceae bacterium]